MGLIKRTAADYRDRLLNLFPRGRAWAKDITSNLAAMMHAIGDEFAILHERVRALIEEESNPLSANETIDQWEKSLGLPDACSSAAPTLAERQASAAGRYYGNGGHNLPYLIDVADQMGYDINIIDKVKPHHYEIKVLDTPVSVLKTGTGPGHRVGYPLRTYGDEKALECVFMRLNQAHAVPTFTYRAAQLTKIYDPEGNAEDHFGAAVAIAGDKSVLIVGNDLTDNNGATNNGSVAVYTYVNGAWSELQVIVPSSPVNGQNFGCWVDANKDGSTIIIGSYGDVIDSKAGQGSAYIYVRGTNGLYTLQQKLTASDGAAGDKFGGAVAIDDNGDTVIIGAEYDAVTYTAQGSAYIFTRTAGVWTQQQKLTDATGLANDRYGFAVSISGNGSTAIVGAWYVDVGGVTDKGAAYVYTVSVGVWSLQQKLTDSDGLANDRFGSAVALDALGDTAVVGAFNDDAPNTDQGSACIFTRTAGVWTRQQKLSKNDGVGGDVFGRSAAITADGNIVIIGAWSGEAIAANQGWACTFARDPDTGVWQEKYKAYDPNAVANDNLGRAVDICDDGTLAVAGIYKATLGANANQGAALIIDNPTNDYYSLTYDYEAQRYA